jgi:CubicO group peptidase (beta-lactamase class C family)
VDTPPAWEPGTRQGYHGYSFGFLIGELVRKITGVSVGTFFRHEVAEPLGLDFWIGLPEEHEDRVATTIRLDMSRPRATPLPSFFEKLGDRDSLAFKMAANDGGWNRGIDQRAMHAAELPSAGGVTNARGLAGMYAPLALGGEYAGVRLVSAEAIAAMRTAQAVSDRDAVSGARTSYTMGFAKSWANQATGDGNSVIIGEDAFGMPGLGGQIGFADPAYGMAFAYTLNRHGLGSLDARGQSLIDAVYRVLGSPTSAPGFWVRAALGRAGAARRASTSDRPIDVGAGCSHGTLVSRS